MKTVTIRVLAAGVGPGRVPSVLKSPGIDCGE